MADLVTGGARPLPYDDGERVINVIRSGYRDAGGTLAPRPALLPSLLRPTLLLAALLLPVLLLAACSGPAAPAGPAGAPTYFLSPSGSDAAAGTSPATAWRSLGWASSVVLRPGTRLLLEGGQRFTGTLTIGRRDGGNAAKPVLIGSYGRGDATIATSSGSGVAVDDTAGVTIQDLIITGSGAARQHGAGINVYSDLTAASKLVHVAIAGVTVSGFANGISIGAAHASAGFRDVSVTKSVLHDNLDAGLVTYGPPLVAAAPAYANQDVQVSAVAAYHNYGNRSVTAYSTGSGIVLGSVQNGTVEWSAAADNGGAGASGTGPEGIWAYDSTGVTIAHDVSYGNRTRDHIDGNGFGLDENTSASCLEYDLSYSNDGAGYLVYSSQQDQESGGDCVRFDISSGDSQDQNHGFAGITVAGVRDTALYQNTVVMQQLADGSSPALKLGTHLSGITVRNNIFSAPSGPVVAGEDVASATAALLQGNDYFTSSPDWSILWGPGSYPSLAAWRSATGQETVNGQPAGFSSDPDLTGPVLGLQATAWSGAAASGFQLRAGSPLIGSGLDLSRLFGMDPGTLDFGGSSVSVLHPNVGAQ